MGGDIFSVTPPGTFDLQIQSSFELSSTSKYGLQSPFNFDIQNLTNNYDFKVRSTSHSSKIPLLSSAPFGSFKGAAQEL